MGDIFRRVQLCGLTAEGGLLAEVEAEALVDTGATKTVISSRLAKLLHAVGSSKPTAPLKLPPTSINGQAVQQNLIGMRLADPSCAFEVLVVGVSDKFVKLAGKISSGALVEVILGHDYLQNQHVSMRYVDRGDEVRCTKPPAKKRTKRT